MVRYSMYRIAPGVLLLSLMTMIISCNPHRVNTKIDPMVEGSNAYSLQVEGTALQSRWWEAMNDPYLDAIMEQALSDNLTLKQARARIEQAIAADQQAASFLSPDLSGRVSEGKEWKGDESPEDTTIAGVTLSWEIDLWGRLSSARKASAYEIRASR
jgi:outer membrane protein TolC